MDDRNWPDDGRDTIIRDTDPRDIRTFAEALAGNPQNDAPLATSKDMALQREANVIYRAGEALQPVDVESESFGFGRVYAALTTVAQQHVPVRLIVAKRDLSAHCASALQHLIAQGVSVRLSEDDEKMALAQDTGGSVRLMRQWGSKIKSIGDSIFSIEASSQICTSASRRIGRLLSRTLREQRKKRTSVRVRSCDDFV